MVKIGFILATRGSHSRIHELIGGGEEVPVIPGQEVFLSKSKPQ